ncbi:MAG: HesA/MoeB/ThiF family protein [Spirochaetes bacterium]|nr:HesA/MoeB/ThiF family protein [Spirochaetota bacterium]
MLTKKERELYQRQMLMPSWGTEAQEKLCRSTVFIAGAGGLGSPVIAYLAAAGIGNLVICDSDTVVLSNLNRQIVHSFSTLGTPKVDSAARRLAETNPYVAIRAICTRITSRNMSSIIGAPDIIIDCLDNFQTRLIVNEYAVRHSLPLLHGGIEAMRGQISFFTPPDTPCLACILPGRMKRSGRKIPVVGATAGVIGSLQALEAIKFLTGIGSTLRNRMLFWDGQDMRFDTVAISRNPKCSVCGGK